MIFGSVCSGIEAASVAWNPLGWRAAWVSEIAPFPCAVLAHRHPGVPNLGDMTALRARRADLGTVDVLVGGTPCQSFSVAGLRKGLDDPRGNLALVFLGLADTLRPEWVVWENVPGVLSNDEGRSLGTFLGALGELGYGWAYRVLEAQYCGLAQRRKRVFVVANLGGWPRAAAVLLERAGLSGDPPPRREAGKGVAPSLASRPTGGGGPGTDFDLDGGVIPLQEVGRRTGKSTDDVRFGIGIGKPGDPMFTLQAGAQHGVAFGGNRQFGPQEAAVGINGQGGSGRMDFESEAFVVAPTLRSGSVGPQSHDTANPDAHPLVVGSLRGEGFDASEDGTGRQPLVAETLRSHPRPGSNSLGSLFGVRRLTPREWERLQGFPDDYTLVPYRRQPAKDGPRYKALGNSMAVPVMRWIGRRIEAVAAIREAA